VGEVLGGGVGIHGRVFFGEFFKYNERKLFKNIFIVFNSSVN
jgi:hypothetical protein